MFVFAEQTAMGNVMEHYVGKSYKNHEGKIFLLVNIHNSQINFFCFDFDFDKAFSRSGGISILSPVLFRPSPSACVL